MATILPLDSRPPTSLLVVQAAGILASTYLFGSNASVAFITIPTILQAPSHLAARQWTKVYDIAKPIGIGCTFVATTCAAYVAWHEDPQSLAFRLNTAAALIMPVIMPFTVLAIAPTNNKLFAKAESRDSEAKDETTKRLLEKWTALHLVRTAITGVGAALALWAGLDRRVV